jgi:asparaginyl-tRNA synthetase
VTPHNSIADCLSGKIKENELVTLHGWVKTKRESKAGIAFINLHDGSCFASIQVVAPESLDNYQSDISRLTAGCSISVTGTLVPSLGKGQSFEVQANKVEVVGWVSNPDTYPIQAKRHTLEYLRDVAHLRMRTNTLSAVTPFIVSLMNVVFVGLLPPSLPPAIAKVLVKCFV